jgi:hypothetical protein
MIAATVALGLAVVVLAVVLGLMERAHGAERNEWANERRSLVDRAIARHSGEVLALDRNGRPKPEHDEPKLIVGL